LDTKAGVKYTSWAGDQWVSYDDADTFKLKVDFANSRCLAGTMVWAVDLDTMTGLAASQLQSGGTLGNSLSFDPSRKLVNAKQSAAQVGLFWTPCLRDRDRKCPYRYRPRVEGFGKIFDFDLGKQVAR
jgi:chitinase